MAPAAAGAVQQDNSRMSTLHKTYLTPQPDSECGCAHAPASLLHARQHVSCCCSSSSKHNSLSWQQPDWWHACSSSSCYPLLVACLLSLQPSLQRRTTAVVQKLHSETHAHMPHTLLWQARNDSTVCLTRMCSLHHQEYWYHSIIDDARIAANHAAAALTAAQ